MICRSPQTEVEWQEYYDLRFRILREPWHQPRGSERNEGDATGIHLALYSAKKVCAIARLDLVNEQQGQTRFVAVENGYQGSGLGKKIMKAAEFKARELGCSEMILHARTTALDFYKRLGYNDQGASYLLFDVIQHHLMSKQLD